VPFLLDPKASWQSEEFNTIFSAYKDLLSFEREGRLTKFTPE